MDSDKHLEVNGLYEFGIFRLDANTGQLYAGNESVKIAPKVLDCLILLVGSEGRIVSKNEFFDKIWTDAFVEDNSLSYAISQLRKILAEYEPTAIYIETVPRRGFRFVPAVQRSEETKLAEPGFSIVLEKETIEEVWSEEEGGGSESVTKQLSEKRRGSAGMYLAGSAIIVLVLVIAGLAIFGYRQTPDPNTTRTIAVLPLKYTDDSDGNRVFAIGLTDAMISQLGKSDRIIARPLASVIGVSEKISDPIEAGRLLSVDAVLDWNLQQKDGVLRISARLLNVADGKQIWSAIFQESEGDIFRIQDAVSIRAADSLLANLSQRELNVFHERSTTNKIAYETYLRGRYYWNKRDLQGFTEAQRLFEQAIGLDPKFAEAHSGLADVHLGFYDYGYKPAKESIPKAISAAKTALKLDPELADAYSTIASIEFLYDRNWVAAEKSFKRAIALAPNNATARLRFGWTLSVASRYKEGLEQLKVAERLDPTSRIGQTNIAYNLLVSGQLEKAGSKLNEIKNVYPEFSLPYWYQGSIYFINGDTGKAIDEYLKALEIDEGDSEMIRRIKKTKIERGEKEALKTWREELEARYKESYMPPSNIALVAALEKNEVEAIKWLKIADTLRDPWLLQIAHDAEYRFLDNNPEFQTILKNLGFTK